MILLFKHYRILSLAMLNCILTLRFVLTNRNQQQLAKLNLAHKFTNIFKTLKLFQDRYNSAKQKIDTEITYLATNTNINSFPFSNAHLARYEHLTDFHIRDREAIMKFRYSIPGKFNRITEREFDIMIADFSDFEGKLRSLIL